MHSLQIQLSDPAFAEAIRWATARGVSVEAIVAADLEAHLLGNGVIEESFFTSRILFEIDEARDESRKGHGLTLDQVREMRLATSKAWRENHTPNRFCRQGGPKTPE